MDRTVLTYTWLCNRAKYLYDNRREDFNELIRGGTSRFLTNYFVRLDLFAGFTIYLPTKESDQPGVEIGKVIGLWTPKGLYSRLMFRLTPTKYRKRFWDRYMPVSFPAGVPKRGTGQLPAVFHAPNGAEASGTVYMPHWRNDPAHFSLTCSSPGTFLINDTAGTLVHFCDLSNNPIDTSTGAIETHNWDYSSPGSVTFPEWRSTDYCEVTGYNPDQSTTREQWLKSIYQAAEKGLVDKEICLPLAARMWNAAYQFCQSSKDKHASFVAYPMMRPSEVTRGNAAPDVVLKWDSFTTTNVRGHDEQVPTYASSALRWCLPQIVVSFEGGRQQRDTTHPFWHNEPLIQRRHITMTLPPHGNPLLEARDHYAYAACKSFPSKAHMKGEYADHGLQSVLVLNSDELIVRHLERAYHGLIILDPSINDPHVLRKVKAYYRKWVPNCSWEGAEQKICQAWNGMTDCIHVVSDFDERSADHRGETFWSDSTQDDVGIAATPEAAVAMVEEANLLASLPLS